MRKSLLAVLIIGVVIALDAVLANIPGPVPTSQAVSNAEHSSSFQGIVGNGTYFYSGNSDNPSWDLRCVETSGEAVLHLINPFHEYTTTTLIFYVQPPPNNLALGPFPFILLVQVNPASGAIYSTQTEPICA
jgi:hypothetical protein